MRHETRIEKRPTGGGNSLVYTGRRPEGGLRRITVTKNAHIDGNAAQGNCKPRTAEIQVNDNAFASASTRQPPFSIIIEADADGVAQAWNVETAA